MARLSRKSLQRVGVAVRQIERKKGPLGVSTNSWPWGRAKESECLIELTAAANVSGLSYLAFAVMGNPHGITSVQNPFFLRLDIGSTVLARPTEADPAVYVAVAVKPKSWPVLATCFASEDFDANSSTVSVNSVAAYSPPRSALFTTELPSSVGNGIGSSGKTGDVLFISPTDSFGSLAWEIVTSSNSGGSLKELTVDESNGVSGLTADAFTVVEAGVADVENPRKLRLKSGDKVLVRPTEADPDIYEAVVGPRNPMPTGANCLLDGAMLAASTTGAIDGITKIRPAGAVLLANEIIAITAADNDLGWDGDDNAPAMIEFYEGEGVLQAVFINVRCPL